MMQSRTVPWWVFPLATAISCAIDGADRLDFEESNPPAAGATAPAPRVEETPRVAALARILSGTPIENAWFSPEDLDRAKSLEIAGNSHALHGEYFDRIEDPLHCSVIRTRLMFDGRRGKSQRVEIDCDEFWGMIEAVDRYFEVWGELPASAMDLEPFLDASGIDSEWDDE